MKRIMIAGIITLGLIIIGFGIINWHKSSTQPDTTIAEPVTLSTDKTFQPLSQNPEYIIVIKKQTPHKVLGNTVIQGDQVKQILAEINSSHKLIAAKSCPASLDSFDVVVHYDNGLDRTFTALSCPGTVDQADGITIEPGISYQDLDKLFKQQ